MASLLSPVRGGHHAGMDDRLKEVSWTVGGGVSLGGSHPLPSPVTAASSTPDTVGSAFVRVRLDLEGRQVGSHGSLAPSPGPSTAAQEPVSLELSPKEFFALLHQLETARTTLQSVATTES